MKITQKFTREQMRSSRKDLKRIKSNRHPKFFQFSMMHIKQMRQFQFFLRNYWDKNHILVKNKKFLLWQYKYGSFLSYVIAKLENKIIRLMADYGETGDLAFGEVIDRLHHQVRPIQAKKFEDGIFFNDRDINAKWPRTKLIVSKKDKLLGSFQDFKIKYKGL